MSHQLKYEKLLESLKGFNRVAVAFSGGVDSTFLLKAAVEALGAKNVLAVTSDAETYPERELKEAMSLAKEIGCEHLVIHTSELNIPGYAENPINRCYFCKQELFTNLIPVAQERGFDQVIFGAIADDLSDYRPGFKAAKEKGVRAPLQDVELTKADIRALSYQMNLRTWDKPSFACLSSRIPYGEKITQEKLTMIDKAEQFLMDLGFRQVRVRQHEKLARIEVVPQDIQKLAGFNEMIVSKLKSIGYMYITIDLQGYRSGSLNETIKTPKLSMV
ncbi:ATP-dependent sacrificial sulfur transferase LarE [Bacillus sp. AFS037270]|uniref:ATP-dependent sacrificial sulfur transferase LarE n=1 Tax=Bacillus sp. AFS037270 TaxID=2033499 RepID=UPI000BFD9946|nr:ATP-dependent sacrificial sulfur transferase LarE [Bacillus sp. AFS037270]PGV55792.1 TIGR00268 family protein [Bacillus sp. AFS037270]